MSDLVLMGVVVAVAAFAQGSTGMGFALIAAPVIGLVDPALLPVAVLIQMLPLNAYVAWRERHAIDLRGVSWVGAARVIGTFGGLWVLLVVTERAFSLLVGISTVVAVLVTLLAPAFQPGRAAFIGAGVATGVTETATGIGGPPLALVFQHHEAAALRSSVAVCFLVGEVVSLVVLGVSGEIGSDQVLTALILVPAVLVGAIASRFTHHRLAGNRMRQVVLGIAVLSGLVVIVQAW